MNYVDAIDVSGVNTPPANAEGPPVQTLNEEVNQVLGQLNSFWGGFRKQSQIAFQSAKKDFGEVVQQAQNELTKFTAEPSSPSTSDAPQPEASTSSTRETIQDGKPKEDDPEGDSESDNESTSSTIAPASSTGTSFSAQSIFGRLQSSIPPNLVSTVQSNIPPSIRHAAAGSVDFSQLKTTLTTEFTRVQGITRAQAEEYVQKSEELFREAGEFLKDAVKVVPPESENENVGVMWDGSDVWMLPAMAASVASERTAGASASGTEHSSAEGTRAVATRAEELLRRLRYDDTVIKADPEAEEIVKALYGEWVSNQVDSVGGIDGEEWSEKRRLALDAEGLPGLKDSIVPSEMTEEIFWTRYFFRVYQIEREAERRKALLQGTSDSEDAFSWEDDDEEPSSAPAHKTANTHSPRESSEGSYDVVSGRNSGEAAEKDRPVPTPENGDDSEEGSDGGDSDWE